MEKEIKGKEKIALEKAKPEAVTENQSELMILKRENKALKDVLVNMLMQKELMEIKNVDNSINSLEDMDLNTYFALRNQNIPINVVLSAINQNKKTPPTTGDIKQTDNIEKGNKYKEMPRNQFLKEIEKAMRGELM